MRKIFLVLSILYVVFFAGVPFPLAKPVSKNSVILDTVRDLTTAQGSVYAGESIYVGGITADQSIKPGPGSQESSMVLRELHSPDGVFTVTKGGSTVEIQVVPMVVESHQNGRFRPALGHWEFTFENTNNYESVIHVQMAGDLDIAYQSSQMKIGEQEDVLHYGLSGNPHAISLSRKRLQKAFASQTSFSNIKPVLNYQVPNDIIIVLIEVTPEGFVFEPLFDYQTAKE
ncbi:hypothetical protein [Candidatus Nitrospira allomarina]|uniref:Uncharacterized protein n=1 Tax=Candidatus Nitrospira allomarina TaxID=3020900 RepID=A0AA96JWN1_9BACT|nr:hypothetical protein [Candidatus Nitrospira allomarina]WNM58096.1 hypothetical protein PP769_19330 [Candidatus Nitrospira allomarina]